MTVGYSETLVDGVATEVSSGTVNAVLHDLLRYEEILGAIAVSVDGLVIGRVGVEEEDADFLAMLGSSLVGVAERSTRRIGAGSALSMSIAASDGMLMVRNAGSFALTIQSEPVDVALVVDASRAAVGEIATLFNPV